SGFAETIKHISKHDEKTVFSGEEGELLLNLKGVDNTDLMRGMGEMRDYGLLSINFYGMEDDSEFEIGKIPWDERNPETRENVPDIERRIRQDECDLLDKDMMKLNQPLGLYAQETHFDDSHYDIQLIYDPEYQAKCCYKEEGPSACEIEELQGFGLGTCNKTILNEDDCKVEFGRNGLECKEN
ncbi:MAG: hypothetical protein ACOCZQ_00130, partial [Nanoarchaeota archaeon]